MNTWLIVAIIAGLIVIAGVVVVNALAIAEETSEPDQQACSYTEAKCPYAGSCDQQKNCGLSSCQSVKSGSGCGCGR